MCNIPPVTTCAPTVGTSTPTTAPITAPAASGAATSGAALGASNITPSSAVRLGGNVGGPTNTGHVTPEAQLTPTSVVTIDKPGNYSGLRFPPGQTVRVTASDVTISDSLFPGGLLLTGTNRVSVSNSTIVGGLSLSSTDETRISGVEIHSSNDDLIHITGDGGRPVTRTTFDTVWAHSPKPAPGAHADGMQIRGARDLMLRNVTLDMGPWIEIPGQETPNAAFFLEEANGGNSGVRVESSYLNGGGYTVYGSPDPSKLVMNNTRIGTDFKWGERYPGS